MGMKRLDGRKEGDEEGKEGVKDADKKKRDGRGRRLR